MDTMEIQILTSLDEKSEKHSILKIIPNPTYNTTTLFYVLTEANDVKIEIFNMLGGKISEIKNNHQTPGSHSVNINLHSPTDKNTFSKGIYFLYFFTVEREYFDKMMVY